MAWVKVVDRKPEHGEFVLALVPERISIEQLAKEPPRLKQRVVGRHETSDVWYCASSGKQVPDPVAWHDLPEVPDELAGQSWRWESRRGALSDAEVAEIGMKWDHAYAIDFFPCPGLPGAWMPPAWAWLPADSIPLDEGRPVLLRFWHPKYNTANVDAARFSKQFIGDARWLTADGLEIDRSRIIGWQPIFLPEVGRT